MSGTYGSCDSARAASVRTIRIGSCSSDKADWTMAGGAPAESARGAVARTNGSGSTMAAVIAGTDADEAYRCSSGKAVARAIAG